MIKVFKTADTSNLGCFLYLKNEQKKVGVNAALEGVIQKGLSSKIFEPRTEE